MRGSTAGLAEALEGESRPHRALLAVLDTLFSCLVVAPAVVGYWRGTWELFNMYVYPEQPVLSSLLSMCLGAVGHLTLMLAQGFLKKYLHPDRSRLNYFLCSRLYTVVYGVVSVNSWRGPWGLMEMLMERGSSAAPLLVSVVALMALRCLRNVMAPPFALALDRPTEYFDVPSMFRISSAREPLLFVLDCIFSVVVVGSLVVFVWRGAWDMLDFYIYPQDKVWSAWGSAVLGYGLAVVTFLLQPLARRACSHLQAARRLLLADLFLLLSFVATVNVWRSVWMLLDIYFIPENPLLSNWITHAGCLLLLMLLNCANSVMVRGVYIDAEEEGGQCVVFPCYYLRLYFQKERSKKRLRRLEKASQASDRDAMGSLPLVSKSQSGNHVTVTVTEKEHLSEKPADKTNGNDC